MRTSGHTTVIATIILYSSPVEKWVIIFPLWTPRVFGTYTVLHSDVHVGSIYKPGGPLVYVKTNYSTPGQARV